MAQKSIILTLDVAGEMVVLPELLKVVENRTVRPTTSRRHHLAREAPLRSRLTARMGRWRTRRPTYRVVANDAVWPDLSMP